MRFFAISTLFSVLWSQAPTGGITGTVTDGTGAIVAGATVTIKNTATNAQRTAASNEAGAYNIPSLPPGPYTVRVEMKGFTSQVRSDIDLQVGQVARLDFSLQVGNVQEVVEVSGQAPTIDTDTSAVGTVIENKRIVDLPLNGRNYLQLASLIPGATTNGPASSQGQGRMGGQRNEFALNISGQRVHYNHYTLDGIENTDPNFNTYLLLPSIDALQEFKVESGIMAAEYGRAIAQLNVTTKSGTNAYHGALFEFLRNSALDAKNFFDAGNKPIPAFRRNQFGGTVGGPVTIPKLFNGRDKLFFFFDYEGLRESKGLSQTATVPSAAYRSGDFSGLSAIVYDPKSRVLDSTGKLVSATPFLNNRIPSDRISPVSQKVLNFFPLPNIVQGVVANNFLNTEGRTSTADQETGKVDYQMTPNDSWIFRYSHSGEVRYSPINIPNQGNNVTVQVHQSLLGNTWVMSSNKVNEFKFGISRLESGNIARRAGVEDVVGTLGIAQIPHDFPLYWGVPNISFTGFSGIGEASDTPFINWDTVFQWTDNFTWTKGRHNIKFGTDIRHTRFNQIGGVVTRGRFAADGRYTTGPGVSATPVNSTADFLLGLLSNSEGQIGKPVANFRDNYYSFYIQDDWRITSKLTLNIGLRYEDETPWTDKFDNIVNIDFRWDNSQAPVYVRAGKGDPYGGFPAFRLPPQIPYVRDGRFGRGAFQNDINDFAPRLGLAYSLNNKTVIRTGAGIFYVRDIGNATFDVVRNGPFSTRLSEPANLTVPNLTWEKPFTTTATPSFILANQFNEPTSYVGQWSFGVQRQLSTNTSLEVTYLGSTGVHLRRLTTYNAAPPGPGSTSARRAFPSLGGTVQNMNAPSHSTYHGLQARFQQRFSHGLTLLSSFAYSKSIDNGSGIRTTDGDSLTPSNNYNLNGERGLSAFDFRKRLTTSALYELPVGRGKRFLNSAPGLVDVLLGGWQVGSIITFQDGFPATATCGFGNVQNSDTTCYPDATGINPNLSRDQQDPAHFFNTAAFVDRIPGLGPQFRYGNSGRNTIIGPGIIDWDFSTSKRFKFNEQRNLEFRSEFFNIPNHPIFNQPGTSPGRPQYGVIGSTKVESRQLQFGLKLNF
jgi:hypothetical protein